MSKMLYQMVCKTLVIFNRPTRHSNTMKCKFCNANSEEFDVCEPCEQKLALIGWSKEYD
jgi:primosomal protein N'